MIDEAAKDKLTKALARTVAMRQQVAKARDGVQRHASDMLDHRQHAVEVASKHLEHSDNPLVYRYARVQMTEAHELRAVTHRAEHARAKKADQDKGDR